MGLLLNQSRDEPCVYTMANVSRLKVVQFCTGIEKKKGARYNRTEIHVRVLLPSPSHYTPSPIDPI